MFKEYYLIMTWDDEGFLIAKNKYSENSLIVEIEYFISLCEFNISELKEFDSSKFKLLRKIYIDF